ncbi:MAG: hypothetical protein KC468_22660 [Myxococcales bacterium]|nr:hypothetical protein [Myxococcales bacterium]
MTPEEHVTTVEQAVAQGFERTIGGLKSDLKKAQEELDAATKELAAVQSQNAVLETKATRQIEEAVKLVHRTMGGQWTDLAVILGGVVGGFVTGYWLQRTIDVRAPVMAIGGAIITGFGLFNTGWHLTTRAAVAGGGASLILGSVVHVFVLPPTPVPGQPPAPTAGGAA